MDTTQQQVRTADVLVVGAGAAGRAAALVLGRARRDVVLVDDGRPANAPSAGVGGLLGLDGTAPGELYARSDVELVRYPTVRRLTGTVDGLDETSGGWRASLEGGGAVDVPHVVLTTGMRYDYSDLPGVEELWGGAVFHCPFCHGWEHRDERLLVLGDGVMTVERTLLLRTWSDEVVVLAQGETLGDEGRRRLDRAGVQVLPGTAVAVRQGQARGLPVDGRAPGDVVVDLDDGRTARADAVLVAAPHVRRDAWLDPLGLEDDGAGHVVVDGSGRTSRDGLWAAGDLTTPVAAVSVAAASGSRAAFGVVLAVVAREHDLPLPAPSGTGQVQQEAADEPGSGLPPLPEDASGLPAWWERLYDGRDQRWSGRANPRLVEVVESLGDEVPGRALDLGCGEGGDAVWLAGRGFDVVAVDGAEAALVRARALAAEQGASVAFERHDLTQTSPAGQFDLVSAQFLQAPLEWPRAEVLRHAAAAVAPGGRLLVVDHSEAPPWAPPAMHDLDFPQPADVLADLALDDTAWTVERAEVVEREATGPDGEPGVLRDGVVLIRRRV